MYQYTDNMTIVVQTYHARLKDPEEESYSELAAVVLDDAFHDRCEAEEKHVERKPDVWFETL